ncbi:MAG: GtrA family protein [Erythrobacter sp.]|nr:GtrA family protein [Erythrobacter sp.]
MSELARFFAVTVLGVVIDIAIAYALATQFGVPLWLAATIGFVTAAGCNYIAHQLWSFRAGPRALSAVRAAKYAGAALMTLAVRVAIVALLDRVLADDLSLAILICGAGGSFFMNFALSKFFVFAAQPETP